MIRIFPDLDEDLLIRLFHKSSKFAWTSRDLDWEAPLMLSERQALALARLLTPVYLGEQTAMIGASVIMPQLMAAGESTAQVYLASFIYDEARHFEALTRLYGRIEQHPVGIREVPEMLRYHHRLRQGDRADWVWGILISDLFAKQFYSSFFKKQPDALFGKMSGRILQDESRHQAFADEYLKRAIPKMTDERRFNLLTMRDELMDTMEGIYQRLYDDSEALGLDGRQFLDRLMADIDMHARRIGLIPDPDDPDGLPRSHRGTMISLAERRQQKAQAERSEQHVQRIVLPPGVSAQPTTADDDCEGEDEGACDTCYLAAICQSRLVKGAAV